MKISDLMENKSEEFDSELKQQIMDVLVLYNVTGTSQTNLSNIISELNKNNISIDIETLTDIIKDIGYDVRDDVVVFDGDVDTDEELENTDGEEYDPVSDMAKDATEKSLK